MLNFGKYRSDYAKTGNVSIQFHTLSHHITRISLREITRVLTPHRKVGWNNKYKEKSNIL